MVDLAGAPIGAEEAKFLVEAAPKRLASQVVWTLRSDGYGSLVIELECPDGTPLRVRGWRSPGGIGDHVRFGFSLLYRNSVVLRRWDDKRGHRDPVSGSRTKGPHKHFADPEWGDSRAYETDDVSTTDPNAAIADFLVECGVSRAEIKIQRSILDYG